MRGMRKAPVLVFAAAVFIAALAVSERPAYSHRPITTTIIFKKEIAQIFQRKCFQCHSDNNLSMSFTTYETARPWARAIREEVVARHMPPWGAVTGFGHFANDVSLTQREIDIILNWEDGGAPSGVLKVEESVPPVYVPAQALWELGQPDETISIGKPFAVEPGSGTQVRRFEVRAQFPAPRALRAVAFKPGDRRVVRYAAIYETSTGRWLATWTPWHPSFTLPADVVYRLPARAALTVEIGYRAAEESVADESEVGLYFSDARDSEDARPVIIAGTAVTVAPGAGAQRVRSEMVLPDSRRVIALWPELGEGVRSIELSAIDPEGVNEPLLWLKEARRDWPTSYVLEQPRAFPRGTRLLLTSYYENTSDKPLVVKPSLVVLTAADAAASTSRERGNVERKRDR
jgi:hypothetical protein